MRKEKKINTTTGFYKNPVRNQLRGCDSHCNKRLVLLFS